MGSLGFALGGALAGGGAGIAAVGQEMTQARIQQKLMEMREQYQTSLQTRGFQHQEEMMGKEHEFQLAGAKAGREFQQEELTRRLTSEEKRATEQRATQIRTAEIRKEGLLGAAQIRTGGAANKPVKPSSEWSVKNIPFPNASDPLQSHTATIMTHKSGLQLGQLKDGRWVPFTGDVGNMPDPTSIARAPAGDVKLLLQHPEQSQQFLAHWKYLPPEWQAAEAQRFSARQNEYETRGRSIDQPATGGSDEEADDRELNTPDAAEGDSGQSAGGGTAPESPPT